ncbi:Kef-type transport system (probable substrate potassium) (plasmid) [Natrialba magadii ATCC 43099]|uniref:Kef-type transport system (Probable substrate potassium) n=1 Tax=Natrialba magadii (strain ATCC 43099 / DSM 3394 / CCM 3739 / CIP 104546 / IAM 13178 / JCM 8861 / NBRC 102185 / NCIMB 2190 / MS3) TaxID=547559 RepID=D3T235_NATMM|nr:cation:proton antiporter [Natrialba magadii]ADD07644.1 Kef-type transport system (probable substrate potassium) [Natrialba magadii ATCC 43099]ELY27124.1 sodium/hydrogen exchanger [Natrialba magadii ATCC 43099]
MVDVGLASDVAIILVAAALVGVLAVRLGQPTIIGYILTGVVIGPVGLGLVEPSIITDTMAELGLAFLLFLLGIKMRIDDIRHLIAPIVKISIPQMAAIGLVGFGLAAALPFSVEESVIIGLAVMYSSTAVVIKMLNDKGEATSLHGKMDVGVLLAQDIVVVIILAVLAAGRPEDAADIAATLAVVMVLVTVTTVAAIAASRYVLPPLFRRIADDTTFLFLVAISWLFLFVLVSDQIDVLLAPFGIDAYLSVEMGAFLAGLAIAQLPYSKDLQGRVNPLTDLFVMIFFVSVALDFEARHLLEYWQEAIVVGAVLMVVKFVVFFSLLYWQRFDLETTFLGSIGMVQVSEFGIVVAVAAVETDPQFIGQEELGFITLVALLTMSVSVYFMQYNKQLFERAKPYLSRWEQTDPVEPAKTEYRDHVVVVGYDEIARRALRILEEQYDNIVVVDRNVEHVEAIEDAGYEALFGDFRYEKIRKDARVKYADFVFSSSDQVAINEILLDETSEETTVFVEAATADEAGRLYDHGADYVIMAPQLGVTQFIEYLESYLENRAAFDREIAGDMELLQSGRLFPDISDRPGGDHD